FTNENNPLPYKRQSKYFKMDFEDRRILQRLEKRDIEESVPDLRSYQHLHRLLLSLFQKYYNNDPTWLPEMGMSLIELDICKKYFDGSEPNESSGDLV